MGPQAHTQAFGFPKGTTTLVPGTSSVHAIPWASRGQCLDNWYKLGVMPTKRDIGPLKDAFLISGS